MFISKKTQYAVRAVFELAIQYGTGPVKTSSIAEAQGSPAKFLEAVLGELKNGGFVRAMRGKNGGFQLAKAPAQITLGEVIRHIQGPFTPVSCMEDSASAEECPLFGDCVFMPVWKKTEQAIESVLNSVTYEDLVNEGRARIAAKASVLQYTI